MLTMESRMHRKVHVRFGGGVTAASPKQNNVHICSAWAASRTLPYHLGRDPERRVTANGDAVTQFTLATTETWKDKSTGERKQTTEWHRVVLYRKLAEIAGEYLKKGSLVYVEGRLQTRKWVGKDDVERIAVEIIADDMRMLGGRPHEHDGESEHADEHHADADQGQAQQRDTGTASRAGASRFDLIDDAIPF